MGSLFPGLDAAHNAHPAFVHFPIGVWAVALVFWGLGAWRRRDDLFTLGTWLALAGVAVAAITLLSGYLAADKLGHDSPGHDLVHTHRDLMVAATIVMAAVAGTGWVMRRRQTTLIRWALVAALAAGYGLLTVGADRGALLVFGHGVGVTAPPVGAAPPAPHDHGEAAPSHDGGHDDHGSRPHEH